MRKLGIIAATILAAGVFGPASAQTITTTVDCARGQKIATALLQGDWRRPLVVNIRGTCNEFVKIDRANVTLRGDPSATIVAPSADGDVVTIDEDGITLENLTLTGGNYGIRQEHAVRVMITNCVIQDTAGNGFHAWVGDTRIVNSTIQRAGGHGVNLARGATAGITGSTIISNKNSGIYAAGNAYVNVAGSNVSGNGTDGVSLQNGSVGTFSRTIISVNGVDRSRSGVGLTVASSQANVGPGNDIANNPQFGVFVYNGSVVTVSGSKIYNNGWDGVIGYLGTSMVLYGNEITGNGAGVGCRVNCTLELNGDTINFNSGVGVHLEQGSKLMLNGAINAPSNFGGGLVCSDKESSVGGDGTFDGPVSNCTDFNN